MICVVACRILPTRADVAQRRASTLVFASYAAGVLLTISTVAMFAATSFCRNLWAVVVRCPATQLAWGKRSGTSGDFTVSACEKISAFSITSMPLTGGLRHLSEDTHSWEFGTCLQLSFVAVQADEGEDRRSRNPSQLQGSSGEALHLTGTDLFRDNGGSFGCSGRFSWSRPRTLGGPPGFT